jgi:hypothetical protein
VGIFASSAGRWQATGLALPSSLARRDIEVLGLAAAGQTSVALLQAGLGGAASLLTAWSADGGHHWRLSAPFGLHGQAVRSAAFGTGGAVGVTLTGGAAVSVTGPGAAWRSLPALPAEAAKVPAAGVTLAAAPGSGFDALIGRVGRLSVWQLASGATGWTRVQVINVTIPYGSSGGGD